MPAFRHPFSYRLRHRGAVLADIEGDAWIAISADGALAIEELALDVWAPATADSPGHHLQVPLTGSEGILARQLADEIHAWLRGPCGQEIQDQAAAEGFPDAWWPARHKS